MTERLERGWGHSRKTSPKREGLLEEADVAEKVAGGVGNLEVLPLRHSPSSLHLMAWPPPQQLLEEEGHSSCSSRAHLSIYPCPVPLSLQSWKHLSLLCLATANKEAPDQPKRGPESVCPGCLPAVGHLERSKSRTESTPPHTRPWSGDPWLPSSLTDSSGKSGQEGAAGSFSCKQEVGLEKEPWWLVRSEGSPFAAGSAGVSLCHQDGEGRRAGRRGSNPRPMLRSWSTAPLACARSVTAWLRGTRCNFPSMRFQWRPSTEGVWGEEEQCGVPRALAPCPCLHLVARGHVDLLLLTSKEGNLITNPPF